jgi:hypothetical protein
MHKKIKQNLLKEFQVAIDQIQAEIDHLNETRLPWPMYDEVLGIPQDKLEVRKNILEALRDADLKLSYGGW